MHVDYLYPKVVHRGIYFALWLLESVLSYCTYWLPIPQSCIWGRLISPATFDLNHVTLNLNPLSGLVCRGHQRQCFHSVHVDYLYPKGVHGSVYFPVTIDIDSVTLTIKSVTTSTWHYGGQGVLSLRRQSLLFLLTLTYAYMYDRDFVSPLKRLNTFNFLILLHNFYHMFLVILKDLFF